MCAYQSAEEQVARGRKSSDLVDEHMKGKNFPLIHTLVYLKSFPWYDIQLQKPNQTKQ